MGDPNLHVVSGNLHVLRERARREFVHNHFIRGWRVDHADGERPRELRGSLSTGGVLFDGQVLVVVDNPEKADLELLQDHKDGGDQDTVVVLNHVGKINRATKFGKFAASLGKSFREFNQPEKSWEMDDFAVQFCLDEAKYLHKAIQPALAKAIISRSGNDVGFLSFEMHKMSVLADADGVSEIAALHVRDGLASIAQVQAFPVVEALSDRNRPALALALSRVVKTSRDDPTMGVCRLIGGQAIKWLGVVLLREKGIRGDAAAGQLGENPWYFNNKLEPLTLKWDGRSIRALIRALAESERGVRNGHVSPWVAMEARLLEVCG